MSLFFRIDRTLICLLAIAGSHFLATAYSMNPGHSGSDMGVPNGLMVEYIREPTKVDIRDSRPEYSWIVPIEAVAQKGYQVVVSTRRAQIDRNIGTAWDSQQVRSSPCLCGRPAKS